MEKMTQNQRRLRERYTRRVKEMQSVTGEVVPEITGPYDKLKDEFEMIVRHVARGSKPIFLDSGDSDYFGNKFLASLLLSAGVSKWPKLDWRSIKHKDIYLASFAVRWAWNKLGAMQRFISPKRNSSKILVCRVTNDCVSYNVLCNIEQVGVRVSMYKEENTRYCPFTITPDTFMFYADYFIRTKGGEEFIVSADMDSRDSITGNWSNIKKTIPEMRYYEFTDGFLYS